mmetsp:Transcript_26025/g.42962  ORF Transcript_26025/g.42962 Transcript_26025/m.42962 type:complete len:411 (+) Transcript_26025:100-1332(+)
MERDALSYTCDRLTPELCDLHLTNGTMLVRGLHLRYWIFDLPRPALTPINQSSTSFRRPALTPSLLPIIMVHGGPGWSHHYMLPLKQQACRGRKVIFYDQVGAGLSEKPASAANTTAPWLLTIPYYVTELQTVADNLLGSNQNFHLLGSSWGTIVAQEYALQMPPPAQLASLTLSGPLSDGQLYIRSQWDATEGNLGTLPPFTQERIRKLERTPGGFDSLEYKLLNEHLEASFTVRTYPAPDCFKTAAALMNSEIYVAMQGPSEFTISGVLGRWSVTSQLHRVATPTLLTHGMYDTMRPPVLRVLQRALQHAKVVLMPHSGHCSMIDDPKLMNDEVAAFLTCVESGASAATCTEGGEMMSALQVAETSAARAFNGSMLEPVVPLSLMVAAIAVAMLGRLLRQAVQLGSLL